VELADGGTLFLDEIGNVPLKSQGKLLRVLEAGEFERVGSSRTARVDARIVAATNADLQAEVAAGRFRQDLFFRLNTVEIHLPPLRARREDIPLLAGHFLSQHARRYRRTVNQFTPAAMREMLESPWPGNVRQLDHVIERAVLMSQGDSIQPQDLGLQRSTTTGGAAQKLDEMTLEEVEKALVEKALARHGGNISQAAESLGLSRTALYRRIEKHGLKGKDDE
jgi:DNA-binding NtrC family response regulator